MEDIQILELFFARSETAIQETDDAIAIKSPSAFWKTGRTRRKASAIPIIPPGMPSRRKSPQDYLLT